MPRARHRAEHRSFAWRPTGALSRLAAAAGIVTATVVAAGVVTGASSEPSDVTARVSTSAVSVDLARMVESREQRVSRTADRVRLEPRPVGRKYAEEALAVHRHPSARSKVVVELERAAEVAVTGQAEGRWAEVLVKDAPLWVRADQLVDEQPKPEGGAAVFGLSSAPCPDGSAIEGGLTPAADRVYRAVCAAFPQPTTYGGLDPHGEHVDGRAIDIMISGEVGWQIAEWLRAHAAELQIRDVIYSQRIWIPERASEGWRAMSDRGSPTANHYDHVHVAVY